MTFEISKDRIIFPQPGNLLTDGDVFQLLDRNMKYPTVSESGISSVFTVATDPPNESVVFSPELPKIFFSKSYNKIPYLDILSLHHDHNDIGYYFNPIGAHPRQWLTLMDIEKDGFTFSFGNFFGSPSGPTGRYDFTLYWTVYDIDYIPEV